MSECRFVAGSLGSGGISEAASLGEQSWRLSGGVLGETALPGFWVMSREEWDTSRIPGTRSRVDVEFLIGEGIAHAKPRQEYGVEPLSPDQIGAGTG